MSTHLLKNPIVGDISKTLGWSTFYEVPYICWTHETLLLMVQKSCTTLDVINNGINYQPQLVSRIQKHPAHLVWSKWWIFQPAMLVYSSVHFLDPLNAIFANGVSYPDLVSNCSGGWTWRRMIAALKTSVSWPSADIFVTETCEDTGYPYFFEGTPTCLTSKITVDFVWDANIWNPWWGLANIILDS